LRKGYPSKIRATPLLGTQNVTSKGVVNKNQLNKKLFFMFVKDRHIRATIAYIMGTVTEDGESVVYYDNTTKKFYLSPIKDIDRLIGLMLWHNNESIRKEAYARWFDSAQHPECDAYGNVVNNSENSL
jgi:hypothetical protein